jgi:hypothetical protein
MNGANENDRTLITAGALVLAGLLTLGIPPWILFGM